MTDKSTDLEHRDDEYEQLTADCEPTPVTYLWDGGEVVGEEAARFGWGSDAGMTSGSGGHVLTVARAGEAVSVPYGDEIESGAEAIGFRFTQTATGLAEAVAQWVNRCDRGGQGAAALALEPLDPGTKIAPEAREEWETAVGALSSGYGETAWMQFDLANDVKQELRRVLAIDGSTYVRVRDALADPPSGEWLLTALTRSDLEVLW